MNKELFISEAVFAKLVFTPQGPGILIAGNVYHIVCPDRNEAGEVTEAFVSALRGLPRTAVDGAVVGLAAGHTVNGVSNTFGVSRGGVT